MFDTLRFTGQIGAFSKSKERVITQSFLLPQSEGPNVAILNSLDMGSKLFVAIKFGGVVFQCGYANLAPYSRDSKGGYKLSVEAASSAFTPPPDEWLGEKEVEVSYISPEELERLIQLSQSEVASATV